MSEHEDAPRIGGVEAVQNAQRVVLPKRFYAAATSAPRDGGFAVLLDSRPVRTPAKKLLVVPSERLAAALAEEWAAQKDTINPATMPLTRLVNSALDGVTGREAEVRAEIVKYAGGDMLFYRADGPASLVASQARHWDSVIAWAERFVGGRFVLAEGIMPVSQPATTLEKFAARIADLPALPLAGLHVITTLTGSALLALAHAEQHFDAAAVWAAAHVDEDHQIEKWGADEEAEARRANRWRDMQAASLLLTHSRH